VSAHRIMKAIASLLLGVSMLASIASADPRDDRDNKGHDRQREAVLDHRYNHDHYYPARGYAINRLPPGYNSARYHGSNYYFHGGVWYRPYGPRFVVVAPPIGIGIGALPPFYTTVWFGGIPYYYADNAYYVWRPQQRVYEVTEPPGGQASATTAAPNSQDLFIYPKNGQSDAQQATDRYDCHSWARQQTGFDPTQPSGGVDEAQTAGKRADYQRAETACLEARGYTVK
jgi:hypothetical protein